MSKIGSNRNDNNNNNSNNANKGYDPDKSAGHKNVHLSSYGSTWEVAKYLKSLSLLHFSHA